MSCRCLTIFKAAGLALLAVALVAPAAQAHTDPPGATLTGVGQSFGVFSDAGCTNSITGQTIVECQEIYVQATLQWQGVNVLGQINAAFEQGRWILTAAGAQIADLGNVPCIGGTADDAAAPGGRGACAGAPTQLAGACVPYTPTAADIAAGFVQFQALYGDSIPTSANTGYSHIGAGDLPGASASITQTVLIDECDNPATDCWEAEVCDPALGCVQPPKPLTTICRPSAGICDVAESCDGVNPDCPPDEKVSATTECRASAGICDVAESCDGINNDCPDDGFVTATTECRASAGVCDVSESCTGTGPDCPPDGYVSATTECRASAGVCDVPESCTGAGPDCPGDGYASATTECRAAAGECDLAESCTGDAPVCPGDEYKPLSTPCSDLDGNLCTAEHCDGLGACVPNPPADVVCDDPVCEECLPDTGQCELIDPPPAECVAVGICRTPGFWCQRAGGDDKGYDYTGAVIDYQGGCLEVCGNLICDTWPLQGSLGSAQEALCMRSNDPSQLNQAYRQMTASALNCIVSGGGNNCNAFFAAELGFGFEDFWDGCNANCAAASADLVGAAAGDYDWGPYGLNTCYQKFDYWNNSPDCHERGLCEGPVFDEFAGFPDCTVYPEPLGPASGQTYGKLATRSMCSLSYPGACAENPCFDVCLPFELCEPQTCGTFTECDPGTGCLCFELYDDPGTGGCISDALCGVNCSAGGSADCADGEVCIFNTCCGYPNCVPAECSGGAAPFSSLDRVPSNSGF